jgi:hypothetical protein
MKIKVEIKDHDKIQMKLNKLSSKLIPSLFEILVDGAMKTRNEMITSMENSPPLGRKYPSRKKGKKWHIASLPGNPPRVDTGNLIASIIPDIREDELEVEVGSILFDPPYPLILEQPKEDGVRLLPRPYVWPALEKIKNDIMKAIVNIL